MFINYSFDIRLATIYLYDGKRLPHYNNKKALMGKRLHVAAPEPLW
ncbi:hypothetical protein DFR28_103335 [Arenicella xantha]|uniref:Uncharacterized protein n=1 Tax=Arenicella xantha TaxID=644221 RepID=A0A395JJ71_9GAMM|nr:hypothetical protein DFR28_103335 [Arenicella xantha]